ncbi:unnamed protein product [Diatraea saccharalis]|uniref:Uncharacterized protein n=1 Tax=Diatraea saccharalis TaxID=40085 RepID=A0A9N9R0Y5_9NEOP|nr:unnamed protein product [Diatraea saccharalis]
MSMKDKKKIKQRHTIEWQNNRRKVLRNSGKEYTTCDGTVRHAKKMGPMCHKNCRLKCSSKVCDEDRLRLFRKFWDLGSVEKRWAFIANLVIKKKKCRQLTDAISRRNFTLVYRLPKKIETKEEIITVCKTMFLNTLSVTERNIYTSLKKIDNISGMVKMDMRGRHTNRRVPTEDVIKKCICMAIKVNVKVDVDVDVDGDVDPKTVSARVPRTQTPHLLAPRLKIYAAASVHIENEVLEQPISKIKKRVIPKSIDPSVVSATIAGWSTIPNMEVNQHVTMDLEVGEPVPVEMEVKERSGFNLDTARTGNNSDSDSRSSTSANSGYRTGIGAISGSISDTSSGTVSSTGSEDEDDVTDEDLDDGNNMVPIPRTLRIYYEDEEETVSGNACLDPCFPPATSADSLIALREEISTSHGQRSHFQEILENVFREGSMEMLQYFEGMQSEGLLKTVVHSAIKRVIQEERKSRSVSKSKSRRRCLKKVDTVTLEAIRQVVQDGCSIRTIAKSHSISKSKLGRLVKKTKDNLRNCAYLYLDDDS